MGTMNNTTEYLPPDFSAFRRGRPSAQEFFSTQEEWMPIHDELPRKKFAVPTRPGRNAEKSGGHSFQPENAIERDRKSKI